MNEVLADNGFPPLSSLRLIVPPLQLVSAALLEIVKQGAVMYFGLLEEFITTVLETAPELLTDTERLQLVIGLRAKVVLEMCRNDTFASQQAFQLYLSQINTYITNQEKETSHSDVKASVTNFLSLVRTLMEDQCQKENFYQNIFPSVFGPKYDSALQALMRKFLLNLQELLPVPDFEQTSLWLNLSPSIMRESVDLMNQTLPLKTLILHHKHHGHKVLQASSPSSDGILSSLSYKLQNEDNNKTKTVFKSEPICDTQDWQTVNLLTCQSSNKREEKVLYSDFVRDVKEDGQHCVDDLTEEEGASVEVTVPSFDGNESNDDDEQMDKTWFNHFQADNLTFKDEGSPVCRGSTSLLLHTKPPPADDVGPSFPLEISNKVCKVSVSIGSPQDQTCQRELCTKQCHICKEMFSCSSDLIRHMQCHSELHPYLCSHCGEGFENYGDYKIHKEGKCRASYQHLKESSMSNPPTVTTNKSYAGNSSKTTQSQNATALNSTVVSGGISQNLTAAIKTADSKLCKPHLTCPECNQRFTYCKSFEKHLKKCLEAAQRKEQTNTKRVSIKVCDFSSSENTSESQAEKNSETMEIQTLTTMSTINDPLGSKDEDEYFQSSMCRKNFSEIAAMKRHFSESQVRDLCSEDTSICNEIKNHNNPVVSNEICQTSAAEEPADLKPCKPILTCPECGKHFNDFKRFEEHKIKCSEADSQPDKQRSTNFLVIKGCDFFSLDNTNECHAGESSEKMESQTATAQPTAVESQTLKSENKSADLKACKPFMTCPDCGMRFTYCKSFEKHLKKCSEEAAQIKEGSVTKHLIIKGCHVSSAGNTSESQEEKSSETMEIQTSTPSTEEDASLSNLKSSILKCTMCEENFTEIAVMKRHYYESHGVRGSYPCSLCNINFARLCDLVRHQQNKKLFLCAICRKGFRHQEEMEKHKKVHAESAKPCKCETCGKVFKSHAPLIRHRRKHRDRPPVVCSYCGKKFSSKDYLRAHMVRHTGGYPCPVCGKVFYQKAYLNYHLNKHAGQEPYLCDTCGKGWPTPALLKVHMVKHREGRPLKCDDCGATYKRESSLISHQRSKHGGMRPFVCEVCSKAFRIKSQLKTHMMVHTGEKPYSCTHCGKKFTKSYNLKKHREKPCVLEKIIGEVVLC